MSNFLHWLNGTEPEPEPEPRPLHSVPATNGNAGNSAYLAATYTGEIEAVTVAEVGTRNLRLYVASRRLGELSHHGAWDRPEAEVVLTGAAHAAGLESAEIIRTIDSGWAAGVADPKPIPAPRTQEVTSWAIPASTTGASSSAADTSTGSDANDAAESVPADPDDIAAAVLRNLPIIDWHALWADDDDEEWIVEPILPARRLVALYSAPKVGKSLLMLEVAVGIATGRSVLGATIDRPRRVLYVDFENDPKADIRERLQAMGVDPGELGALCYLSFPTLAALDGEKGSLELMAAVGIYACEVVVVDTVSRAVDGDENENDTWLNFYRHTGLKLKQAGVALIRLDHSGKDETKGQRGGSAKVGDVDAVWRLSRVSDDTFSLDCEANRMPVAEKRLVLTRVTEPTLHHQVAANAARTAAEAATEAADRALTAAGAVGVIKERDALDLVKGHVPHITRSGVRGAIHRRRRAAGIYAESPE